MSSGGSELPASNGPIGTMNVDETKESVLAYKDKVPEAVHVSLSAWNTFVDREARPEKLAQRLQAKDNRSKKTDAHYLGRTSYAEKEEICMYTQKRKPDRVELYVDARKHPKTKLCHPGAISDMEQINAIRSSQDEASKGSIDTDALTQHFGKDNRGRTRGVGSSVSRTKLKATLPVRNELEKVKAEVRSTNDMMSYILKVVQGLDPSFNRESGGSHSRPNGEAGGIQPTLHGLEKSATGSPSTPTSGPSKCYKLLNLDGSKPIAQVVMMKTAPGSLVHGRPMLSFEVKVNVIKVFPGMGDEPIWKGNQGGVDTLAESEGGFLVWPKYLMEEVLGENRVLAGSTTLSMVSMKHVTNLVEEVFDAVAVATGHSQPRLLAIKGMDMWSGRQMHSHFYKVPEPFRNECYGSVAENTQLWCVLEDLGMSSVDFIEQIKGNLRKRICLGNTPKSSGHIPVQDPCERMIRSDQLPSWSDLLDRTTCLLGPAYLSLFLSGDPDPNHLLMLIYTYPGEPESHPHRVIGRQKQLPVPHEYYTI
ncbi:hypothetical protein LguiA_004466 [Lonicera macranthoides]